MVNLESGDRIELFFEEDPTTTLCATVGRVLTDQEEGMGVEIEDYTACWFEIALDEPCEIDIQQVLLLGTDFQYRLNGRRVTLNKRNG